LVIPKSFTSHPWPPPPLMSLTTPQHMHDTSITWRSFSTSLASHRNKPHSIWSPDAPGIISTCPHSCSSSFWQRVCHFWWRVRWIIAKPEISIEFAVGPSFLAQCPVNYSRIIGQTCKIHRKFILNPKIVKHVLLCYLEYCLSSKQKFDTKKYISILTKIMHFEIYKLHNLLSRCPKFMKLVLLASFKHVLSRRHICVHRLITYVHMTWPLYLTHLNRTLNKWRRVCKPGEVSMSLFIKTEKLEATDLSSQRVRDLPWSVC
jgi:hypothetical protein